MKEKIELKNIYKAFGNKHILQGVNLTVYEGEILCLIGKSGTGKSVILKHLIGLLRPDQGSIRIDGEDFTDTNEATRIRLQHKFGVLFQGAALFDSMSIYDNIAFGLRRQGLPEEKIYHRVHEILQHVGMKDISHKMPADISGGMQKRVGLARAIIMRPEIMLYDEPTTGVDPITAGAVDSLIVHMNKTFHITSIVITHDVNASFKIADRIAMLYEGKIIFTGTPAQLQDTGNPIITQFIEGKAKGPITIE